MKIILLHYSAPPVVGGVESVLGHQARLMADAGHDVRIVAGRGMQTDERVDFVKIAMADSRHPIVLSVKEKLDQGFVFQRVLQLIGDAHRAVPSRFSATWRAK